VLEKVTSKVIPGLKFKASNWEDGKTLSELLPNPQFLISG
jgi:hypothetical protein